jgi:hypothetical protein
MSGVSTLVPSKGPNIGTDRIRILQGTLDLIVLRTLAAMGPQHAYGIATRLQQQGWIAGAWHQMSSLVEKLLCEES